MDFSRLDLSIRDGDRLDVPRPIRSGLALAAVGLLPLALGLADVIPPLSGLVFTAIFVGTGALRWSLGRYELIGIRRRADLELRSQPRPYLLGDFAQWRADELTSDRHRLALARAVARTVRDVSPALLPGASPLNRLAVRPHADLFRKLAERLSALDLPVTPQAVLEVEGLLTSPASPLYARERASELRSSLITCLYALDALAISLPAEPVPATSRPRSTVLRAPRTQVRRFAAAHRRSRR